MPTNDKVKRWLIFASVMIGMAIVLYFVCHGCRREYKVPEGKVLVSEIFLDSLRQVASRPPDTTVIEKVVVKDTTIYIIKNNPTPYIIDLPNNKRVYVDSVIMVDDGIDAWVKINTRGVIDQIMWGYKPVYKTITKEIRIPEPYPMEVRVPTPQRGLILLGGMGAGEGEAGFSLGLLWQQKNGMIYGAEMIQFTERYYMAKVGFKIALKK